MCSSKEVSKDWFDSSHLNSLAENGEMFSRLVAEIAKDADKTERILRIVGLGQHSQIALAVVARMLVRGSVPDSLRDAADLIELADREANDFDGEDRVEFDHVYEVAKAEYREILEREYREEEEWLLQIIQRARRERDEAAACGS